MNSQISIAPIRSVTKCLLSGQQEYYPILLEVYPPPTFERPLSKEVELEVGKEVINKIPSHSLSKAISYSEEEKEGCLVEKGHFT